MSWVWGAGSLFTELVETLLGDLSLDVLAILLALETVILEDATVGYDTWG